MKSTKGEIFQEINIHFSSFCRKFKYVDIIFSLNKWTSQQMEVQKRFRRKLSRSNEILFRSNEKLSRSNEKEVKGFTL